MTTFPQQITDAVSYIREHGGRDSDIGIILGSGLGGLADSLPSSNTISTSAIPHYPRSTVEGHRGKLVFADLAGKRVLAFQGRVHFYESLSVAATLFPLHVAHALGVKTLIVTNAAGGINRSFVPGDLMLITGQINMTGLSVPNAAGNHPPLPFYSERLIAVARSVAESSGIPLKSGAYVGLKGPTYETAAEVEMLFRLGADAAGMSTVLEVDLASHLGMDVLGISCITNLATGISPSRLSHKEVTEVGNRVKGRFTDLVKGIIGKLG